MLRAAASLALLCGAASVPVAERTVAFQHELALPSGLADSSLTAVLAKAAGPLLDGDIQSVTFEAGTHAPTRRLQDTTSVTITYVINCGTTCSAISSQLASITSGGAEGLAFASAMIAAVSAAATDAGFADAVVSTPAEVIATVMAPTVVDISLPPSPSPAPSPAPAPSPVGEVPTAVTTLSVAPAGWTTYQLTVDLPDGYDNIYALAGTPEAPMSLPKAFQAAAPFGADLGGVDPALTAVSPDAGGAYDSWLTIGPTDASAGAGLAASPGLGLAAWTADDAFGTTNGAVFWMNPNDGPTGNGIVMAQLTISDADGSQTMTGLAQGKAVGDDWQSLVAWTMG